MVERHPVYEDAKTLEDYIEIDYRFLFPGILILVSLFFPMFNITEFDQYVHDTDSGRSGFEILSLSIDFVNDRVSWEDNSMMPGQYFLPVILAFIGSLFFIVAGLIPKASFLAGIGELFLIIFLAVYGFTMLLIWDRGIFVTIFNLPTGLGYLIAFFSYMLHLAFLDTNPR